MTVGAKQVTPSASITSTRPTTVSVEI